jgi:hypothetical protein
VAQTVEHLPTKHVALSSVAVSLDSVLLSCLGLFLTHTRPLPPLSPERLFAVGELCVRSVQDSLASSVFQGTYQTGPMMTVLGKGIEGTPAPVPLQ